MPDHTLLLLKPQADISRRLFEGISSLRKSARRTYFKHKQTSPPPDCVFFFFFFAGVLINIPSEGVSLSETDMISRERISGERGAPSLITGDIAVSPTKFLQPFINQIKLSIQSKSFAHRITQEGHAAVF